MSPCRAAAQLRVFPAVSRAAPLAAPLAAVCLTALGCLRGFLNAVVKPGIVPCDPGWLLFSWFPSGACQSLAVIWAPWAAAPLGSGEGSRQSSSHHQGPVTEGRGWWYSWEGVILLSCGFSSA